MRFGLVYTHQLPRPWADGAEQRVLREAMDQIELADRLGFDCVWVVEHHFLEEYSHSSAPEVFLGAVSQRTSRIRLGHGIVQLPRGFNHPARVAERIATLDLLSDGRVEFGTGESGSAAELLGFGIDPATKHDEWREALDVVTRMFVEEPFGGHKGRFVTMPPRNVVPKPQQRPHPPLWVACNGRQKIHLAATLGLGALSYTFLSPDEARVWVDDYYSTLASEECVAAGFDVNPRVACVLPMLCHEDERTALELGIDAAQFFAFGLLHYYAIGPHSPGRTNLWETFERDRAQWGLDRSAGLDRSSQGARLINQALGTPDQLRLLVREYEDAGVDQLLFVVQGGRNRHEDICASLELFAATVMPEFAARAPTREEARREQLAPAIQAALARRPEARAADPAYAVASKL